MINYQIVFKNIDGTQLTTSLKFESDAVARENLIELVTSSETIVRCTTVLSDILVLHIFDDGDGLEVIELPNSLLTERDFFSPKYSQFAPDEIVNSNLIYNQIPRPDEQSGWIDCYFV